MLEEKVEGKYGTAKKVLKYGTYAVATLGLAAVLDPDTLYAAEDAMANPEKVYNVLHGLWDGLMFGPNCLFSMFAEDGASWACDGYGIRSSPNRWDYWVGFAITGGAEATGISFFCGDDDD